MRAGSTLLLGGMTVKKYNIGISIVLLLVSVAMFFGASKMPTVDGPMGAGTWPKILAVCMSLLAVLLLIQSLRDHSGAASPFVMSLGLKRVLIGIVIMLVFCVLLKLFGFIIASVFMIPAIMALMGERRPLVLAGVTAGVLVFIYVVFAMVLNLPLPKGTLL